MKTRTIIVKSKLLIIVTIILWITSCKKDSDRLYSNSLNSFCNKVPIGWNCDVYQYSFDSLPRPQGVKDPLAIVKYTNLAKTYVGINSEQFPTLYLLVYDISQKDELEEIIAKSIMFSWCIPIFYGENESYYVITSPCLINNGCFNCEANSLIYPLHMALKELFTKSTTIPNE